MTRSGLGPIPLTLADISTQKLAHNELKRQFNECRAVKVALRKQIIEANDCEYLDALRNPTTDTINVFSISLKNHMDGYHQDS